MIRPASTATADLWTAVKAARLEAWEHINRIVDDAMGTLDRLDAWTMRAPIAGAAEWEWFFELSRAERVRLGRWFTGCQGPDNIADAYSGDYDLDGAMAEWVRCTRIIDAASSLKIRKYHGYTPGRKALGGQSIDRLFPDSGYELGELFLAQPACTDYYGELFADADVDPEEEATYRPSLEDFEALLGDEATF